MLNTFYRVSIFLREEPINKQTARQTACFFTLMPHRADVKHGEPMRQHHMNKMSAGSKPLECFITVMTCTCKNPLNKQSWQPSSQTVIPTAWTTPHLLKNKQTKKRTKTKKMFTWLPNDRRLEWETKKQTNIPIWNLRQHQSPHRCPHGEHFSSSEDAHLFCSVEIILHISSYRISS